MFNNDTFGPWNNSGLETLHSEKVLGFSTAYIDNDSTDDIDHYIGSSTLTDPEDEKPWLNADNFGELILVDELLQ